MPWVKLDDSWYDNPKFLDLEPAAIGAWVLGLSYCARHLTDGALTRTALKRLVADCDDLADDLVAAGLWDVTDDGWQVHDYLDYQPSAAEVKEARKKRQDAGRAGGQASAQARAQANATANRSTPSRPVPSPTTSSSPPVIQEGYPQADDDLVLEVAKARGERLGRTSPAWVNAVAKDLARHQASIIDYKNRGKGPAAIDLMLDGEGPKPSKDDGEVAAQTARMERERRRATGEACPDCGDAGLRFDDTLNAAVACDCKAGQEVTV
jgi:hypothetical protein